MTERELQQAASDFVINLEPLDASTAKEELIVLFLLVKAKSEVALLESLEQTESDLYIDAVKQVEQLRKKLMFHNQLAI